MLDIKSYLSGFTYVLNHPLFMKLDNETLIDAIKAYDDLAKEDNDNAAGIADAIRVMLINRAKGVTV